jgi:hypothetical protein
MDKDGNIYAITDGGLSISSDGGTTFTVAHKTSYGAVAIHKGSEIYIVDRGLVLFKN